MKNIGEFLSERIFAHEKPFSPSSPLSKPIRADFFPDEALEAMAKKMANGQGGDLPCFEPFRLSARLHENAHKILHAFRTSDAAARRHETISPATQWLIDNYYTIDKAIKQIRHSFPNRFIRRLPDYPAMKGVPRIFALAWLYVAHTDSAFSVKSLTAMIRAYQTVTPLTIGELWVLPEALRFVLAENARRIAAAIVHDAGMRFAANKAADSIILLLKEGHSAKLETHLAEYNAYVADGSFAGQLLSRLENASVDTSTAIKWLHYKMSEAEAASMRAAGGDNQGAEHNRQAANGMTMGNIIRAFKAIDDTEWAMWFESVCPVDFILHERSDFAELAPSSRNMYRKAVEDIAKGSPLSECAVAEKAIKLADADAAASPSADPKEAKARAAQYLIGKKREELEAACNYKIPLSEKFRRLTDKMKIWAIALPVSVMALILIALVYGLCRYSGAPQFHSAIMALLSAFPAADTAFSLFNKFASWAVSPRELVGYSYVKGVPQEASTLVVVPTLITSRDSIDEQVRNLEVHYLSNPRGVLHFALLSDWKDSQQEETDADRELFAYARAQIAALNKKYPRPQREDETAAEIAEYEPSTPRFYILHRRRQYNASEGCFMGWERKRGKLHELNWLLRGSEKTSFFPPDAPLPVNVRYVMTLDSDTRLTPGGVAKIVGKMSHPLNRAKINPQTRAVTEGYGLMQPRIVPSLSTGKDASILQRIFSGERGLDPYVFAVSDTYQDILGEGTYTGKGLYDIDSFEASLEGRVKDNSVLSHDLLEGSYARAAFTGDIELVEDYPVSYYVDTARRHRWVRGDWQLLPYIFKKSGINGIGRWKMLDNLRRSLMPLAWIAASLAGWCLLSVKGAIIWQIIILLSMYIDPLIGLIRHFFSFSSDYMLRGHLRACALEAGGILFHLVIRVSVLAYTAYYASDAIIRTLYRLGISHKHLLEWTSSDLAKSMSKGKNLTDYVRMMAPAVLPIIMAVYVIAIFWGDVGLSGGDSLWVGFPCIMLWVLSPWTAWFISRPATESDALKLTAEDSALLRSFARRDWAFYEKFVNETNHFLPPDNFQEQPEAVEAHRTSPTNIGLYLLSSLAARDFGWISLREMLDKIDKTLHTLDRMKKFRGHIYNWYETDTLKPMEALYVSTVDSGNLAGHLVALSAALRGWIKQGETTPLLLAPLEGIDDNAAIAAEALSHLIPNLSGKVKQSANAIERDLSAFRADLRKGIADGPAADESTEENIETRQLHLKVLEARAGSLADAAAALNKTVNTRQSGFIAEFAQKLLDCCRAHIADCEQALPLQKGSEAERTDFFRHIERLSDTARRLALAMDFSFLAHNDRRLMSIGYRVHEQERDEGSYDLLASEARLAVLFAIAKGDVKHEYWGRLGRMMVEIGWKGALLSWSGSMFEYLMPPLVMKEPLGSILDQTSQIAVRCQIDYATRLGLPWGISEAAFNARDPQMNYQYCAFGVPSLGLQRELSRNRVIAPYASMLASQYDPAAAAANLKLLDKLGGLGPYGYYDSLDFTPSRVPEGDRYAVVYNYYAHHHGMAIVAVANAIENNLMRERFHSDPAIEAVELLLQEKAPREIPVMNAKAFNPLRSDTDRVEQNSIRITEQPISAPRATQLLSGGAYSLMLTARGSGYSRWNGMAVTRWQTDSSEDSQGSFLFLRDMETGRWWSAASEPTRSAGEDVRAVFTAEKAEFYKESSGIQSVVECLAVPAAEGRGEGEGRRIRLYNQTNHDRVIEIVSYGELALADPASDAAHPVFSRMFVKTEIADKGRTVFASRRRRDESEKPIHVAHFVTESEGEIIAARAETDRRNFIGRGRSIRRPAFFDSIKDFETKSRDTSADGFVMDPAYCISCRIKIPARKKISLVFWTMAAETREKLKADMEHFRRPDAFDREFTAVWTYSQIIRHQIGMTPKDVSDYQTYAGYLLYPEKRWQAPKFIAQNLGKQSDLWPMSISGDYPICVLRIANEAEIPVVKELLRAHEYWRNCGLTADIVLLNERQFSYAQDTQRAIEWVSESYRARSRDAAGKLHVFTLRKDQMSEESHNTLLGAAQIVLHAGNGSLAEQLAHLQAASMPQKENDKQPHAVSLGLVARDKKLKTRRRRQQERAESENSASLPVVLPAPAHDDLLYWNGYGGFGKDGVYHIRRQGRVNTPHPWVNIISNDKFGMHISAGGAPFTWAGNSRDYQLTPWSNDPVSNRPGEALYIVDLASKKKFSPVSAVEWEEDATYETQHGFGWSSFSSEHDGIAAELTHTVDLNYPLRLARLRLSNKSAVKRSLRLYNYVEWVLGNNRAKTAPFIVPSYDAKRAALLVSNPYSIDKSSYVSFIAASHMPSSISADRAEFIGETGTVRHPEAIRNGAPLSGKVEAGGDICSAMAYDVTLPPDGSAEIIFCLGSADNADNAAKLLDYARLADFEDILNKQKDYWEDFAGGLQVRTPDDSFNLLVNHWLPYQAYACRIKARAAFYQASGAFGLRDQLQDTLALLLLKPELAREQIANAASRQFREGDLQHWWLPESGAGVRTMISDDVVWLAYAAALYVSTSGDNAFLDAEIPFIEGDALPAGHLDSYFQPAVSAERASLYQHCCRALDLAIKRKGANGLPLMLGGDWNDGMNHVGSGGKGESVWLGWFLGKTLRDFISIAAARSDDAHVKAWTAELDSLTKALETAGWDGAWYRRAYYDDGTPLGSAQSDEAKIDTIAQSWSIISGLAPKERQNQAFSSMLEHLYDKQAKLIRLFWPPFDKTPHNPGYIKAYPAGIRENGGQYTHGALWSIIAAAELGEKEKAYELFSMANPIHHAADSDTYRVEPYVVAADIYSVEPRRGMGGWTWYTGSAGWLYRAATEAILGLRKRGNRLFFKPSLPRAWASAQVKWRHGKAVYTIAMLQKGEKLSLTLDGKEQDFNAGILLEEQGEHEIALTLPADISAAGGNEAKPAKARIRVSAKPRESDKSEPAK